VFSGSVYRGDRPEIRWHRGCWRGEQRDEHGGGVETALVGSAEDAGEDLLTVGAVPRAIAAAAHLARDDGGPQRVFSAPVGGVEGGVEEKAEDGIEFDDEVLLKSAHRESSTGCACHKRAQSLDVVPTRDGEAVRGDQTGVIAVPRRQRRLEDRFHCRDEGLLAVVEHPNGFQDHSAARQHRFESKSRSLAISLTSSATTN